MSATPSASANKTNLPESIEAVLHLLEAADYVADRALATVLFLPQSFMK